MKKNNLGIEAADRGGIIPKNADHKASIGHNLVDFAQFVLNVCLWGGGGLAHTCTSMKTYRVVKSGHLNAQFVCMADVDSSLASK